MLKQLLASRWISTIIAVLLCVGSLPVAAPAQETKSFMTAEADRVKASNPAQPPDQAMRDSQPVKPEPLSDEEAAKLKARSQEPGPEVAGGALSNLHLTYIVIALAAAVIVLIAK